MTLPAHRFLDRQGVEERKKDKGGKSGKGDDPPHVWVYDFDETITTAPKQLARIAAGLRALGDKVYVVTGNQSPRDTLIKRLSDDYNFPFDNLIQYEDEGTDGLRRAAILKKLDAWGAFDDRAGRAYTLCKVCPQFFVSAKPPGDSKDNADGAKKDAKRILKDTDSTP